MGPIGIQGSQGPTGSQGPQGVTGTRGSDGAVGPTGPRGLQGLQGLAGPTGPTGSQGTVGPAGPTGPQGTTGAVGPVGSIGPTGPAGANGVDAPLPQVDFIGVAGLQATSLSTATRVGTIVMDPSLYASGPTITFTAVLEATAGKTAQCQLYNLTDGALVIGSALTSSSQVPDTRTVTVTLPNALKTYEIQLLMTTLNSGTDRVACTDAKLTLSWS